MGRAGNSSSDAHAAERPLHVALFIQKGIAIEGIRQQLQLNQVEFVNGDDVVARLRAILPAWQSPLYVGDEELRKLVDSADVSIRIDNGHHINATLEIENHSTLARREDPEEVIRRIAQHRAADKGDPQYYARHTVVKAQAELLQQNVVEKPAEDDRPQAKEIGFDH